ncbi:IS91 family transposase [Maribellus comscasis]|uniref:IS91 family transposase n=1 Tax=Maribellus comscasis TaxID=2681766 RepID=A0A6I6JUV5_9BACT|nr:transposase [Maribellus comscasis]QGY44733.1 IS91 family transposase [Maribellus comscasis]QGY44734.1 IS91 family transposase [Maribellus comscasis]QGY46902.1 IS91 family transposase [Maribellus comscasis]QGY46904.1 IS91 family transposase [Maribellus comscasis]QGY46905.1 IS91 family transposase [Maribellus comscasis]
MVYELSKYKNRKVRKFTLAEYFQSWWDRYVKSPNHYITPEQYKAVAAMRACRTEALGIDHYVCEECGEISQVYHSCKNRFCPTCSWKDTMQWAEKIKEQMLDIPHRHVVFTLPHKLNNLISDNKWELLSALFKAAAEAMKDWMMYKYNLTPGIISVLHTFGETKQLHPHIHMILSWGGVNKNNCLEEIKGEYVNYNFIQTKFRCKFEDKLVEMFDSNTLEQNFSDRMDFLKFIKKINDKNWRVHFEPAIQIPEEVIRYIGRYSKRACISEYKITNIDGENISFKYKDYKNLDFYGKPIEKELTLNYREFFPRLLQHVPLPYFRIVRYYGAYAARTKAVLNKTLVKKLNETSEIEENEEIYEMAENPKICKNCNTEKTYLYSTFKNKKNETIYMTRFKPKKNKIKKIAA